MTCVQPEKELRLGSRGALERFRSNVEPGRIGELYAAKRAAMAKRYQPHARAMRSVHVSVSRFCAEEAVPSVYRFWYLTFARELYGRWHRFHGQALELEVAAVVHKWTVARGLDAELLQRVRDVVLEVLEELSSRG